MEKMEKVSKVRKGIMAITVIFFFLIGIGAQVYNAPTNRLARQINLGYRYLSEERYEEAVIAFNQAIKIDEKCVKAYAGGIDAYLSIEDENNCLAFYDQAILMLEGLEKKILEENRDSVISIFLFVDEVYTGELEQAIKILEFGFNLMGSPIIQDRLIEDYQILAVDKIVDGNYKESLLIYDRLLELADDNERVLENLEECLSTYFGVLLREGEYDEIRILSTKYKKIVNGINFEELLNEVGKRESEVKREQEVETGESVKGDIDNLLEYINQCRREEGLLELAWNNELEDACKNFLIDRETAIRKPGLKHSRLILGPDTAAEVVEDIKDIVLMEEWSTVGAATKANQNGYYTWVISFN